MQKRNSTDRPTTLGELVHVLSLVMDDETEVLKTLKALTSSGAVRSGERGHPALRVVG